MIGRTHPGSCKQIDQAGLLAWPSSASINLPARMHGGLAMDLSEAYSSGAARTGWSGKTPASPDFPFHPVAWQCGREPESNEVAAYPAHGAVAKQGKRAGASGRSVRIYPSSHPPRPLWMVAHQQHQRAIVESSVFLPSLRRCGAYFQKFGLCCWVVFPRVKDPRDIGFLTSGLKVVQKRKRPLGTVLCL